MCSISDINVNLSKYTITATHVIFQLIKILRDGCKYCNGQLSQDTSLLDGHCLIIQFKCAQKHINKWAASEQLEDGSFSVNREMICAVETVGEQMESYEELCAAMDLGVVNKFDRKKWVSDIDKIIQEEANKSMDKAVQEENNHTRTLREEQQ
jgi:hypothetical protein